MNFNIWHPQAIPVRQPRIYFGEPPPDTPTYPTYVVVGSRQPEVDSPSVSGQGQTSCRYDGHGGVQLSSPLRRFAAALRIRRRHPALGDGTLRWLDAPPDVLAFARHPAFL